MSFTYALRIYFGFWPAVTLNFGQTKLSRADSCQWVNVWFCLRQTQPFDYIRKKLTEHEVTMGAAPEILPLQHPKSLDISGRRSITLLRNLSVTANFLRFQIGVKKEPPPCG